LGGRVTRALMARGFNFAVADFMLWIGWSVAGFVILDLGVQGWGLLPALVNFLSMQAFVLILHVLKLLHFEQMIRAAIFVRPSESSLWPGKDPRAPANRIAPDLEGELLHIQAQNQYVMVTTTAGARLVRMSMQRALEMLPDDAGICIHRSWWVSRVLLARAEFDTKRSALIAANGQSFPVSKANRVPLRDLMTAMALGQQVPAYAYASDVAKAVS
ncbi:MAG: LytTR family DNA-binding domain-containing protein, partial [Paracoccus sp. (in: a-proteobacteria)]|nr:LytTR family DNA-binding domain-containing protein [Paracoccus sp. (in: a-proteobacteria)]